MNKGLQIDHLARLLHLEVHMVSAYDGALERMEGDKRATRLEELRGSHEQHVLDLTELLREMGEPSPGPTPDVETLFAPGMSVLRNASSADDALHALRMSEQVVARSYEEARTWGVGMQVHDLLARIDHDEQQHLGEVGEMSGVTSKGRSRG